MTNLPRDKNEAHTIMIVGDVHASWGKLNTLINSQHPEIILQVGDFGYWPGDKRYDPALKLKLGSTRLHWCDGNHEDHKALEHAQAAGQLEVTPSCFYQPRGSTLTLPDGRIILFAGGGFSVDNGMRLPGKNWFPNHEILTEDDLANFPDPDKIKIDIVISHTRPSEFDVQGLPWAQWPNWWDRTPDSSERALSEVLRRYQPAQWFLGHFHHYQQGELGGCRWTALNCAGSSERWWDWLDE